MTVFLTIVVIGGFIGGLIGLCVSLRKRAIKKINDTMASWLNHDKNELLTSWGPPTTVFQIDNGDEIWSYNWIGQTSGYADRDSRGNYYIDAPRQYSIKSPFYINTNGIIYNCRWENM